MSSVSSLLSPSIGTAVAFALFVWWFSTGVIIMLVRLPRRTHPWSMGLITVLAGLALVGLNATRDVTTPEAAFAGFTYAIIVWAFLETSFLHGYVTGPRRSPLSDAQARGWSRFSAAFQTVSTHELSILAAGALMLVISKDAANQVGLWTFLVLWSMRISAKLNIFLGAPNVNEEFLPGHLVYLSSYFNRGRASWFFPLSVTLASLAFGVLAHATATATDTFTLVAFALIATLLALAIVEHWFLVLPIPDAALWRWALRAVDLGRISDELPRRPMGSDAVPPVRNADPRSTDAGARPLLRLADPACVIEHSGTSPHVRRALSR